MGVYHPIEWDGRIYFGGIVMFVGLHCGGPLAYWAEGKEDEKVGDGPRVRSITPSNKGGTCVIFDLGPALRNEETVVLEMV